MTKKESIKLIEHYLPIVKVAVLLRDKRGFSIATTKQCVDYQLKANPDRVVQVFTASSAS